MPFVLFQEILKGTRFQDSLNMLREVDPSLKDSSFLFARRYIKGYRESKGDIFLILKWHVSLFFFFCIEKWVMFSKNMYQIHLSKSFNISGLDYSTRLKLFNY
jgi:hypothetical protein